MSVSRSVPATEPPRSSGRSTTRRCWSWLASSALVAALLSLPTCGGGGGGGTAPGATPGGVQLVRIQHGKLVDVYGLRRRGGVQVVELYQADMIVGPDIQDERTASSNRRDDEILFDFLSVNPDTLQPRLLITRELGGAAFNTAVASLDDQVRAVSPAAFGKSGRAAPYSVMPRNAAIRLVFSGDLGIDDSYFYKRDQFGRIIGTKNTQAVQLLEIVGDPSDSDPTGDFRVLDARVIVRDNLILLDPVLLGIEGLQIGARNSASGLPASPNQIGANIRLAVATDGPLAIDGIAEDRVAHLNGLNNDQHRSVIRDFRSGNKHDNSSELSRGFLRDPLPPRLIGEMRMYLERVEDAGPEAKLITIFKNGIEHEFDRGDQIRVQIDTSGSSGQSSITSLEILKDPDDDLGRPAVQRVRVLVRRVHNAAGDDVLEAIDPSERPDFPPHAGPDREDYLRKFAPLAVLVAEYTHRRALLTTPKEYYGDDPRNFLAFSPRPLANTAGVVVTNANVSPFAGVILRFSKPVDMSTIIALDTAFFATRDLLDEDLIEAFIKQRKIEPSRFNEAKFRTPHLIHSRVFDENGSQTVVRIQPTLGFYLDEAMRIAAAKDRPLPFSERRFHYFLHLVGGLGGITDLSGNSLDFQAIQGAGLRVVDHLVLEFGLDARKRAGTGYAHFEDNLAVYNVRRFADSDEDERPSLYLDGEITPRGGLMPADAWPSADMFGPISHLASGELVPRKATRITKYCDSLNQQVAPPQSSPLRWCPLGLRSFQTAATPFAQPIQNPLNPYGCRLQTVWREIDMSLSRTNPLDFNLDVEQMYWAPFAQSPIVFDEFDRVSLFLGHSESRPEPCNNPGGATALGGSGLYDLFLRNYAFNRGVTSPIEWQPPRHPAFLDSVLSINTKDAILESYGVHRYLPLPKFVDASAVATLKSPLFVWRDEQERVQGGDTHGYLRTSTLYPYLLSPFLFGKGRKVSGSPGNLQFTYGGWDNSRAQQLRNGRGTDRKTGGCVGTIALPLLADFWVYPDSPSRPVSNPFRATGANGWQVSLASTAGPTPNFRVYSSGRGGKSPILVDPTHEKWRRAAGGFRPNGAPTIYGDSTLYWIGADFLKRTTVVTAGFVEIADPHRVGTGSGDPRLGPYDVTGKLPTYVYDFEPPLSELPPGTGVSVEFRGASRLNRPNIYWPTVGTNTLTEELFPLDPLKAGDAHIRHWDTRDLRGTVQPRKWWAYPYNDTVTRYTADPNNLADESWTSQFRGPYETFHPSQVLYFNWRFIMTNNVAVDPPLAPRIESFAVAYRLTGN